MSAVRVRVLDGFDDDSFDADCWERLLAAGDSDTVFLTWQYQHAWWQAFGRGRLLLVLAEREGRAVALAPLFCDAGMVYFVGSGGSDYLDFVGEVSDPEVLAALLDAARSQVSGFEGFCFYHVPARSRSADLLRSVAGELALVCVEEGELVAPALDLIADVEAATRAAGKKSLVRHERYFRREGGLEVEHASDADAILPRLDAFFEQHELRWRDTPHPSLFTDPKQRRFYELLTRAAGASGWLRFTELRWQGRAIAFHFGFHYRRVFLWYKPCFAPDLARRSPGEVLLRQLLLAAAEEGADTFDFGLGEEAFKARFASHSARVRTWGLYPIGAEVET